MVSCEMLKLILCAVYSVLHRSLPHFTSLLLPSLLVSISSLLFTSLLLYSSHLFSSLIIILYLRFVIFESILLLITFPFRLFSSHLFSYLIFFSKCYLFYPFNIANLSKQYSSSLPLLTPFPPSSLSTLMKKD
jgi:hypothetical protein